MTLFAALSLSPCSISVPRSARLRETLAHSLRRSLIRRTMKGATHKHRLRKSLMWRFYFSVLLFYEASVFCHKQKQILKYLPCLMQLLWRNTLLLPVFHSFVRTLSVFLSEAGNQSDPDFPALDFWHQGACVMIHVLQMNVITLDKRPALDLEARALIIALGQRCVACKYIYIIYVCLSKCHCCLSTYKGWSCGLGPGDSALCHAFSFSCIIKKLKLLAMYKIIVLQETDYMKIYFRFHETDRKSINPDVLFYAGQAVGSRRGRMEIGYSCSHWWSHIL